MANGSAKITNNFSLWRLFVRETCSNINAIVTISLFLGALALWKQADSEPNEARVNG